MTQPIDYDADLARRLDARLAGYAPVGRIAVTSGSGHRFAAAGVAAASLLLLGVIGVTLEANAYADSQGLSCADALFKIELYAANIADQFRGASIDEQRAAKQRLNDYGQGLVNESCPAGTDIKRGTYPSPSGAVAPAQQFPQGSFGPKPTNPGPNPCQLHPPRLILTSLAFLIRRHDTALRYVATIYRTMYRVKGARHKSS